MYFDIYVPEGQTKPSPRKFYVMYIFNTDEVAEDGTSYSYGQIQADYDGSSLISEVRRVMADNLECPAPKQSDQYSPV